MAKEVKAKVQTKIVGMKHKVPLWEAM